MSGHGSTVERYRGRSVVDDVDGGLLGAGAGAVDAHVLGVAAPRRRPSLMPSSSATSRPARSSPTSPPTSSSVVVRRRRTGRARAPPARGAGRATRRSPPRTACCRTPRPATTSPAGSSPPRAGRPAHGRRSGCRLSTAAGPRHRRCSRDSSLSGFMGHRSFRVVRWRYGCDWPLLLERIRLPRRGAAAVVTTDAREHDGRPWADHGDQRATQQHAQRARTGHDGRLGGQRRPAVQPRRTSG